MKRIGFLLLSVFMCALRCQWGFSLSKRDVYSKLLQSIWHALSSFVELVLIEVQTFPLLKLLADFQQASRSTKAC